MEIVEFATCSRCGNRYKGRFRVENNGEVHCVDCDNPDVFSGIEWRKLEENSSKIEFDMVSDMLMSDIERIYQLHAERDENIMAQFYKEDGSINLDKVYFMGNPLDLASAAQRVAYAALQYLETRDTKYAGEAEDIVERYKELRERKLTDEEIQKFWEDLLSDSIQEIAGEDGL
ncbi:hypothetical protein MOD96_01940 [Bacillus sp. S17B2]|uniref:hypothetical protein n=1 Tax=Bacillus sp. S17B2 TaxID=2918907 RepID=UPI00227F78E7|nr:hypothetical protein [Bacillus sp. S17B2]